VKRDPLLKIDQLMVSYWLGTDGVPFQKQVHLRANLKPSTEIQQ
jgi:hypothetical protein